MNCSKVCFSWEKRKKSLSAFSLEEFVREIEDEKLRKQIEEILKKRDQIEDKVDQLFEELGLDRDFCETYLENTSNFSSKEWEDLQRQKRLLEERFSNYLGEGWGEKIEEKKEKKRKKKSKRKMLGIRKGWTKM